MQNWADNVFTIVASCMHEGIHSWATTIDSQLWATQRHVTQTRLLEIVSWMWAFVPDAACRIVFVWELRCPRNGHRLFMRKNARWMIIDYCTSAFYFSSASLPTSQLTTLFLSCRFLSHLVLSLSYGLIYRIDVVPMSDDCSACWQQHQNSERRAYLLRTFWCVQKSHTPADFPR